MAQLPANAGGRQLQPPDGAVDAVHAVAIVLALVSKRPEQTRRLPWSYVGLRVLHSFVQAVINKIELRFALFMVSSLVLLVLTVRAALALCAG